MPSAPRGRVKATNEIAYAGPRSPLVEIERKIRGFQSLGQEPDRLAGEVRERLGVGPGDRLRYVFDADGVRIERKRNAKRTIHSSPSASGRAKRTMKPMATSSLIAYRAGDVIVVPFRYSDPKSRSWR
jgi:hypothetical protein